MSHFALLKSSRRTASIFAILVTAAILGASATAQAPQALFPIATQLPSPGSPVFAGDFNGDGVPDLATITESSSLEIVLSVGTNAPTTVTTQLNCPSAQGTAQVTFGDVNNDKKLDLVFSCNGYVGIQLGNGDGTFQTPAYFAVNTQMPVLVDLNNDGFLDIAALVPSTTAPQVVVLLNQGASSPGVFQTPKLYAAASGADSLLAGDFNGDGNQDVITANINNGDPNPLFTGFSVLYGKGDGTLNAPATQSASSFSSFTIGDFNGDGVTDLALMLLPPTYTSLFTSVQILLGSTSGKFTPGASMEVVVQGAGPAPLNSLPMAAVSLTTSGDLDLVVTTNVLSVFVNDGKGNFTPSGSYGVSGNPLLFADLTGQGNLGLIVGGTAGTFYFAGDGDGTFQAVPGTPGYGPIADVNNDGIADIVFTPPQGGSYFGTALGRGDGSFSALNQFTQLPATATYYLLMTGDFNGDGKIDTVAIQPGSEGEDPCAQPANAQLFSYLGSGDGRFQAVGAALPLGVAYAAAGVSGDFNSDGKLDLILPYGVCQQGLLFVPGKGDGTFGTPVPLNVSQDNQTPGLLVGDLNNDKKLDFIWGDAVFLGNGDGTFKQIPLTGPAAPNAIAIALADLNGDGILDVVSSPDGAIYAGNGDGTFQTTPFYTVPLPQNTYLKSFATADVNGDGNPDLLLVQTGNGPPYLAVYLGDGHGNFTQDPNSYYVSTSTSTFGVNATVPSRLNNQAPAPASDNKQDLLITLTSGTEYSTPYTVSLLNQTNPPAVKPAPINSATSLQAAPDTGTPGASVTLTAFVFGISPTGSVTFSSNGTTMGTEALVNGTATLQLSFANVGSYAITASYPGDSNNSASTSSVVNVTIGQAATTTALQATPTAGNVNGQITLTANVTGSTPTGTVTFVSGSTSLGKATLTKGAATLQTSFAAAGSYPITANYQGDANNLGSTSSPVTVVIAAPDFTVGAAPTSGSVAAGQSATFTFTVTPLAGYTGTVKFSCGTLPSLATCSFSPATVTLSGGTAVTSTLTVATAAASAMLQPERPFGPSMPWIPAGGMAIAGVMGLAFAPAKIRRSCRQLRLLSWGFLLASLSLAIAGCGGGNSTPSNPGTPAGAYSISVSASDSAGGPQHAASISLTVQ
jgi:Bacterial Ig-like domain (group 3)/FG-GAP-like repeat